jgi:PAS domain S-box-containing protein
MCEGGNLSLIDWHARSSSRSTGDHADDVLPRLPHDHAVQFYDDDAYLSTVVGEFLAGPLRDGEPVVLIATADHRQAFLRRFQDQGIDTAAARRSHRFQLLDADDVLAQFMSGDRPDPDRFRAAMGRMIERGLNGGAAKSVRAYGEMVDVLWKTGNTEGAIELERLWNDLAHRYPFSLLCAYSMANFCRSSDADAFQRICREHSHVVPTESYVAADEQTRMAEVSRLQQRARAYEVEVAEREQVEQRLRQTVLALQEREADLRDVLENAAEGIHLVGPDGTIEWANGAELDMLGYSADEYIGRDIREFYVDERVIEDILARLSAGESLRGAEAQVRHKNGSIRHVLLNSNVRWRDGQFLHTRCFTRDITPLRLATAEREAALAAEREARHEADRAREAAERARAIAEQANRAKSDFLAVMSHELRTPLNAIGGYAELMELGIHGPVTGQQKEVLDRIQRSQRTLLGLINQVLNYARIETGNVYYHIAPVMLHDVLRSAEGLVTPQILAKSLRFESAAHVHGVSVLADVEKLQQILLNLLSNAIKFTDGGGVVRVAIALDRDKAHIRVSDTGVGIPSDKLEAIFEPFVQLDANYTRTTDGVGLGLAISRDLARGMNGDLTVESVYGEGSTFTLTLARAG